MKVVIAGGGTGGHLFSGTAVREKLVKAGVDKVTFIGTRDGIEGRVLPKMGLPVFYIPVGKFRRSGAMAKIVSLLVLPASGMSALVRLIKIGPDVVLGVGGYASGPVVAAARVLGKPCAVIEQNATAGFTNRLLGKIVRRAFLGLPGAASDFPKGIGEFVGNPVREALFSVAPVSSKGGPFTVLVFGGSQGAQRVNQLVCNSLKHLGDIKKDIVFIHLTGVHDYSWVKQAYEKEGISGEVFEFRDDMEKLYARAHWVISRSGAMTVSELAAAGRPSLLIPYPFAVDDHQAKNAQYLVDAEAAVMIRQEQLSDERLAGLIREAFENRGQLEKMGRKARAAARPDAATKIAQWIISAGKKSR